MRGCPKAKNKDVRSVRRVVAMGRGKAMKDPAGITDMFLPT